MAVNQQMIVWPNYAYLKVTQYIKILINIYQTAFNIVIGHNILQFHFFFPVCISLSFMNLWGKKEI